MFVIWQLLSTYLALFFNENKLIVLVHLIYSSNKLHINLKQQNIILIKKMFLYCEENTLRIIYQLHRHRYDFYYHHYHHHHQHRPISAVLTLGSNKNRSSLQNKPSVYFNFYVLVTSGNIVAETRSSNVYVYLHIILCRR